MRIGIIVAWSLSPATPQSPNAATPFAAMAVAIENNELCAMKHLKTKLADGEANWQEVVGNKKLHYSIKNQIFLFVGDVSPSRTCLRYYATLLSCDAEYVFERTQDHMPKK